MSLGSDHIDGYRDSAAGTMQGARFESGLDNSPMYDETFFAANVSSDGAYAVGQMRLYDVGFASMVAMEAEALAELAPLAGRADAVVRLRARAATQRGLIAAHLWDAQGDIITNPNPDPNTNPDPNPNPNPNPKPNPNQAASSRTASGMAPSVGASRPPPSTRCSPAHPPTSRRPACICLLYCSVRS